MIPKDFITEWRDRAPWVLDRQVEQDLVISRALVELFSRAPIADGLAFRGGTALCKLHITPAARYSEDIDLVPTNPGGIGDVLDVIHDALDPWLGKPKWKQTEGRVTLNYRFESEDVPPVGLKLKVEINSREHFTATATSSIASRSARAGSLARPTCSRTTSTSCSARSSARPTSERRDATCLPLASRSSTAPSPPSASSRCSRSIWRRTARRSRARCSSRTSPPRRRTRSSRRVWTELVVRLSGDPWKGG